MVTGTNNLQKVHVCMYTWVGIEAMWSEVPCLKKQDNGIKLQIGSQIHYFLEVSAPTSWL